MRQCDVCKCQAHSLFAMPNGQDMCSYCSDAYVLLQHGKTKAAIQKQYGTVVNWSIIRGFNPSIVTQVLNKKGGYAETAKSKMPISKLDVLMALVNDGFEKEVLEDKLVRR